MIKMFKYEAKRFIYEKRYIAFLLIAIMIPILVVLLGTNTPNDDSHASFGVPLYENWKRVGDEYENWKQKNENYIRAAKEALKKLDFISEEEESWSKRTEDEVEQILKARKQLLFYTYSNENDIAPYDWRYNYLEDLIKKRVEAYDASNKEKEELNASIKKLLSNPWKEMLEGGAFEGDDGSLKMTDEEDKMAKINEEHIQFLIENDIIPNKHESNWKYSLALKNKEYKERIIISQIDKNITPEQKLTADQEETLRYWIDCNVYCIKNNIVPINEGSKYDILLKIDGWLIILILILVLFFSINISTDIKEGTLKNIITHVKKRNRVIFSKSLFYIFVTFVSIAIFFVAAVILTNILCDSEASSDIVLKLGDNSFLVMNVYLLIFIKYMLYVLSAAFWIGFVFLFVILFESGELAVYISALCIGLFDFLKLCLTDKLRLVWMKYVPMYNLNFSRFVYPELVYSYNNFVFSFVQYALYLVIIYAFTKKAFDKYQG